MSNTVKKVSQGSVETLFRRGENACITVWQIYSRQYVPNFIRIGWVLWKIRDNTCWCFLGVNNYIICISVVVRCSIDVAGAALKTEEG